MRKNRYTLFPIQYPELYNIYDVQKKAFWIADEIDLSKDLPDLDKLKKDEKHLLFLILAFFAQSDGIVNKNLCFRFCNEVNIPEAIQFYETQIGIEAQHKETYNKLIDVYVSKQQDKEKLFNAMNNYSFIEKKAKWMFEWIDGQEDFATRLLAFALIEGVFFAGSFCTIYWLKERNLFPGLSQANTLIARDESLHFFFASKLYKTMEQINQKLMQCEVKLQKYMNSNSFDFDKLDNNEIGELVKDIAYYKSLLNPGFVPLEKEKIEKLVKEAVMIEKEFVTDALPMKVLGLNSQLLGKYIEFVADVVTSEFGLGTIFNTKNPFDFMVKYDLRPKGNFFENRVTEYAKAEYEEVDFDNISDNF